LKNIAWHLEEGGARWLGLPCSTRMEHLPSSFYLLSYLMLPDHGKVVLHLPFVLLRATSNRFSTTRSWVQAGGRYSAAQ